MFILSEGLMCRVMHFELMSNSEVRSVLWGTEAKKWQLLHPALAPLLPCPWQGCSGGLSLKSGEEGSEEHHFQFDNCTNHSCQVQFILNK